MYEDNRIIRKCEQAFNSWNKTHIQQANEMTKDLSKEWMLKLCKINENCVFFYKWFDMKDIKDVLLNR